MLSSPRRQSSPASRTVRQGATIAAFGQFPMPQGAASSPAVVPPAATSKIVMHFDATDPATLIDARVMISEDAGATWRFGPGVTGATPRNGKTGAFVGYIEFGGDLYPMVGDPPTPQQLTTATTRIRLDAINGSGKVVPIGPGTITLT